MSERDPDLLELAGRISDGDAVDWEQAERRASSPEARRVVRHLRLVESLAGVHGDRRAGEAADPDETSRTVETDSVAADLPHPARWGDLEIREKDLAAPVADGRPGPSVERSPRRADTLRSSCRSDRRHPSPVPFRVQRLSSDRARRRTRRSRPP